jgi:hypothetical protein
VTSSHDFSSAKVQTKTGCHCFLDQRKAPTTSWAC